MLRVSKKLATAIRGAGVPAYRLAWRADMHPTVLSKLLHGAERVQDNDARLLRLAKLLDLSADEVFEDAPDEPA